MRVLFCNDIAVKAANKGQTRPWPEGASLAKALWTQLVDTAGNTHWCICAGRYDDQEHQKYLSTGGWGFARFKTFDLKPYGKTAVFASE
jgi:hypothetical protein